MFKITSKKGFHITFENQWTISVQIGPGNYCDNYDKYPVGDGNEEAGKVGSFTAECAAWARDGELVDLPNHSNNVTNRSTPAEVLELMNWVASQ